MVAKMTRGREEAGKKNGSKVTRVQRRLLLDSWLYFSAPSHLSEEAPALPPLPTRPWQAHRPFSGGGGRVLASPGGPSLEATAGLEEQVAQMAWGWREEFPQPHKWALGVYSSCSDPVELQASLPLPAFVASSAPTPSAPSSGKVFLSCHC